jgi:hypothetical protein
VHGLAFEDTETVLDDWFSLGHLVSYSKVCIRFFFGGVGRYTAFVDSGYVIDCPTLYMFTIYEDTAFFEVGILLCAGVSVPHVIVVFSFNNPSHISSRIVNDLCAPCYIFRQY